MFRLLRPALLSLLAFPSLLLAQVSVLDPQFGAGGQLFRPEFGAGYRPMGACPHPSGSITAVGSNIVGTQIEVVITRVLPNGELDTAFSGDGIHRLPGLALNLTSNVAAACSGLGTPEPSDDRLTLFTSTNYAVQSFQVDLDLGQYATAFCGGVACSINLPQVLGLGGQILSAVVVRGLQPSADGRWLLTGQFHLEGAPTSRGFLFRFGTDGALAGTLVPEFPNSTAVETANAHEQDGVIRFLAVIHGAAGFHLATVRTDSALSGAFFDTTWGQMASRPTLGKGRFIGNQTLVAPVWFLGQSPGLVVVKPGQLQVVTLPAEPMGGNGIPNQSVEQTLAATASGATGVLVAAGLQDGEGLGAGIYVARVDLRGGTPRVDTEFGDGGAKRIGWQPAGGGCLPGENAHVQLGALVSWQQANLVLGTSRTACPWSGDTSFFGMRVVAAPLLSDGFE